MAWGADELPPALKPWKDTSYTQRYILRVDPPGAAGAAGLMNDPAIASVILPLRMVELDGVLQPEPVLLIGEDGATNPVLMRQLGREVEVVFRTAAGLRRFCMYSLYSGAADNPGRKISSAMTEPPPVRVKMRAWGDKSPTRIGAPFLIYTPEHPLTLDLFKKLDDVAENLLTSAPQSVPNINTPECPFFKIKIDVFGRFESLFNPLNYAAQYEGLLRAPVAGDYKFAFDTLGAAHLLIDGNPIITAPHPDAARAPFALSGTCKLSAGIHRLVVYYAEANVERRSNVELGRFGIRLHWQPPFSGGLMCIPPHAFPRALPAAVAGVENFENIPQPFIHIESAGQVRMGAHHGENAAREAVLLVARASGADPSMKLRISAPGQPERTVPAGGGNPLALWAPAETELSLMLLQGQDKKTSRTVLFPALFKSAPAEIVDLEGELLAKSVPDFVHPSETAHLHLEALLSPAPVIVLKERLESRATRQAGGVGVELPAAPRPMGEFKIHWALLQDGKVLDAPTELDATPLPQPLLGGRRKGLVSVPAGKVAERARSGNLQLSMGLSVGGVFTDVHAFRWLETTVAWPGTLQAGPGNLFFIPNGGAGVHARQADAQAAPVPPASSQPSAKTSGETPAVLDDWVLCHTGPERPLILIPPEDEAYYRSRAFIGLVEGRGDDKAALFVGDPLVENVAPDSEPHGLAKLLAASASKYAWKTVLVAGPHRGLPIFRILAGVDGFIAAQPGGKIPSLVVLSLGGGDVARQTPLHTFERALDALIDRLRLAGAKTIVVAGVIPEPGRQKQCEPYQERVQDILRRHHVDSVNILHDWSALGNWAARFALPGLEGKPVYGPVPNAKALDEIVEMIKSRL